MTNPKTSVSGITAIVSGAAYLLVAFANHTPLSLEGTSLALTSIATGVGLIFARDASQSQQVVEELRARLDQLEKPVDKPAAPVPPS